MLDPKPNRYSVVPLVLLALLLIATTLGDVWHHHSNSTSEDNCPICHLNHQPMERPLASHRSPTLIPTGPGPETFDYESAPNPTVVRVPARAPPTA
jgi:hypothetical protein